MGHVVRQTRAAVGLAGISLANVVFLAGCGMAAAPQPPSLHLPRPIKNLKAARTGNTVKLNWTSPQETTDRLKLHGPVNFRVCRKQGSFPCQTVGTTTGIPGKPATFIDQLAPALTTGPLHPATYRMYGLNQHGRSAEPSNAAVVLLGAAPATIADLSASMTETGVVLRWHPLSGLPPGTQIQLHRTLLLPPDAGKKTSSAPATEEPLEQTLAVTTNAAGIDPGQALDTSVQFDRTYRYTADRVVTSQLDKLSLQAASNNSNAATITTRDTFPPAAPVGLAAIPISAGMNGGHPEVDLSWSPNTEPDLAQYRVDRQEIESRKDVAQPTAQRIAPEKESEPLVAPAFRDTQVQPGHTYVYTVTAVDASDNESGPSAEIRVTVPEP